MSGKRSRIAVCVALLYLTAATARSHDASRPNQSTGLPVVESARGFLDDWFSKRDVERTQRWFGDGAYRHSALLNEPCTGFSKDEMNTEAARRAAVRTYLRDFLADEPATRLRT
jgi:hypothetical protein